MSFPISTSPSKVLHLRLLNYRQKIKPGHCPQTYRERLFAGKTFTQVAQAHGKTAADLMNAFVADHKTALAKAVAEGRLTQTVADQMLATMKANVEQHVNETYQPRGMGYRWTR